MPRQQADTPSLPLYLSEVPRAAEDFALYRAALPLALLPRGDGHPVLVLPGLLADDRSTRPLRTMLRRLGYRVHGWRLGRNIGPTATCVDGMHALVVDLHERYGRSINIVGWSLGSIFARQLARDEAAHVRQVITSAAPSSWPTAIRAGHTRPSSGTPTCTPRT